MSREEAMRRHPSYLAKVVRDAQDRQAMDVANRGRVDAELHAGGPMRRINERHHEVSTGPQGRWLDVLVPLVIALVIFGVIWGSAFLGALVGGWPA